MQDGYRVCSQWNKTASNSGRNTKKAGQNMNEAFNFNENLFTTVYGIADHENGIK